MIYFLLLWGTFLSTNLASPVAEHPSESSINSLSSDPGDELNDLGIDSNALELPTTSGNEPINLDIDQGTISPLSGVDNSFLTGDNLEVSEASACNSETSSDDSSNAISLNENVHFRLGRRQICHQRVEKTAPKSTMNNPPEAQKPPETENQPTRMDYMGGAFYDPNGRCRGQERFVSCAGPEVVQPGFALLVRVLNCVPSTWHTYGDAQSR